MTNGSKTGEICRCKELLLLCIRKTCMLRYCTLSRSFVKIRLQDTPLPHFSKTLSFSLFDFILKGCWIQKTNFQKTFDRVFSSFYVYFLLSIFHSNRLKKRSKESRMLKKPLFCAKHLIHTVGNKWDHNKALLQIWRESDKRAILFFQTKKKKNIRNGIHCTQA